MTEKSNNLKFEPNNLFYYMLEKFANRDRSDKLTICNEGGSRSSKTWDTFHLIVYLCWHIKKPLSIYILRKTLTECRDKTFDEFIRFTKEIGIYDQNAYVTSPKPNYKIGQHIIKFRGLDDEKDTEGYPSDICFLNEALEIQSESLIRGIYMRCTMLFIADWNPKFTQHWIFKWEGRENTIFTKTTYKNNKHCPEAVKKELQGYEPTVENIQKGTANAYRYKVYTCGERGSMEGLVFPRVNWVDKMTDNTERYLYGLDFGNTTGVYAFVQACKNEQGRWYDCPIYGSMATGSDIQNDSNSGLINFYKALKSWANQNNITEIVCISDSAQPQKISDLNTFSMNDNLNFKFVPVKKFPGCVKHRIDLINREPINLVKRQYIQEEQENYCYAEIRGIKLDEPIDDFNHFWDAAGYATQYMVY